MRRTVERLGLAAAIAGLLLLSAAFLVGLSTPRNLSETAAPVVLAAS